MPEMDGFEATSIISEMTKDNYIDPVFIVGLTAEEVDQVTKEKSIKAGMIDIYTKPLNKDTFNELLEKYFFPK